METCEAVLTLIRERKNLIVDNISFPDEEERNEPAIDVRIKCRTIEIVLEHTRIESYSSQALRSVNLLILHLMRPSRSISKARRDVLDRRSHLSLQVAVQSFHCRALGAASPCDNAEQIPRQYILNDARQI